MNYFTHLDSLMKYIMLNIMCCFFIAIWAAENTNAKLVCEFVKVLGVVDLEKHVQEIDMSFFSAEDRINVVKQRVSEMHVFPIYTIVEAVLANTLLMYECIKEDYNQKQNDREKIIYQHYLEGALYFLWSWKTPDFVRIFRLTKVLYEIAPEVLYPEHTVWKIIKQQFDKCNKTVSILERENLLAWRVALTSEEQKQARLQSEQIIFLTSFMNEVQKFLFTVKSRYH